MALSRIGIAASDSTMDIDLEDCGYCGLFEVMALISADLSQELVEAEIAIGRKRDPDLTTAEAYLAGHAASLKLTPPATLINKDGAPSDALLAYCKEHGINLDRLFPSDPPKEPVQ